VRCENVRQQLGPFSAGELPADDREELRDHLLECAACWAALAEMDRLGGILAGIRTPPFPGGFAARVLASARRRQESTSVLTWNRVQYWRMASVPMRAAAVAVLAVGLVVGAMMGWTAASMPGRSQATGQADPIDTYQIESLGEAPEGSLASSYLTLVSATNEGGR